MNYIKNNFLSFIILVLIGIIFLERCNNKPPNIPSVITKRDTVWVVKDGTVVNSKPQIIKTIHEKDSIIREYYRIPDSTSHQELLQMYNSLVEKYLVTNIQVDSLKIDSLGYVKVSDTVSKNMIVGRTYNYNLKYPLVKETQFIPIKPKNQIYIGGGLSGNRQGVINQIDGGVLLKTKRDKIFGVKAGLNTQGQASYGIQSYWKIK
jgi:hypothetical protein